MCRHDKCWGICAWWAIKPDTSAEHIQQDVLFCPCVCLKIPSLGPTWAPPVRRRRTLGGVRVIHARQMVTSYISVFRDIVGILGLACKMIFLTCKMHTWIYLNHLESAWLEHWWSEKGPKMNSWQMCRHDKCWGICAWWAIKPDTSAEHIHQDVLFCPCVCPKIPSLGPTNC